MPATVPIMPFVILALLALPIKLDGKQLKGLAFSLWLIGGLILFWRGGLFLAQASGTTSGALIALVAAVALLIGGAKGKFVLSKTSRKNIERLDALTEAKRPIHVYNLRSWIMIGLMGLISVLLTLGQTPDLLRGGVNVAIGIALAVSSLAYARSLTETPESTLQKQE